MRRDSAGDPHVSVRVELQLGREPIGDLDARIQVGVSDDDHPVGDERHQPVAARRADGEQIDRADPLAVVGEQAREPLDVRDPPLPCARLKIDAAL